MKTKNKVFEIPFIGYDYGKEHGWALVLET